MQPLNEVSFSCDYQYNGARSTVEFQLKRLANIPFEHEGNYYIIKRLESWSA